MKNGGWPPCAVMQESEYENKLGDRIMKQLSNSIIAKYRNFSYFLASIIFHGLRLQQENQSINQSINQSVNQSINQSFNLYLHSLPVIRLNGNEIQVSKKTEAQMHA